MPDKEEAAGNTLCIVKTDDAVWREKDRTELMILRQYRTKTACELCTRLACIFSDVSYENSLKYDSIPSSFS